MLTAVVGKEKDDWLEEVRMGKQCLQAKSDDWENDDTMGKIREVRRTS